MPQGGEVRIETGHVEIENGNRLHHLNLGQGRYISVCIRDTGIGMFGPCKQRIFRSFFTTRIKGRHGPRSVHGIRIIKQSSGHIEVESEEGKGSAFRIFFPATYDKPEREYRVVRRLPSLRTDEDPCDRG